MLKSAAPSGIFRDQQTRAETQRHTNCKAIAEIVQAVPMITIQASVAMPASFSSSRGKLAVAVRVVVLLVVVMENMMVVMMVVDEIIGLAECIMEMRMAFILAPSGYIFIVNFLRMGMAIMTSSSSKIAGC